MAKIVVSGASGDLGRRITALLLESMSPHDLTLVTRTPDKLADRAVEGVAVRPGDYNRPEALEAAYAGSDTLMLISGLAVTKRVPEHRNAINAAKKAGIQHIVYTSVAGIHPRNPTLSASDHIVTEGDLRDSGLGYTVLRNATYAEVFPTIAAQPVLRTGKWVQVAGNGMLAPVSKRDIARCAATCLINPDWHSGAVYEITGPELVSMRQIAALAAETYAVPIDYVEVSVEERYAMFDALGIPRTYNEEMNAHPDAHLWCSEEMVTADIAFQQDFHAILSHHVEMITGRKPHSLRDVFEFCKGKRYDEC
ncbi:MAG: NAD(P)-dependent oxidoreductase [Sphingomonas bacterium]|nr:NAD(P)-dependent oxidoreductase [Sphingomonas bacterium]